MVTGGKDVGRDSQGVWDGHGHTAVFNMENQRGPAGQHRDSAQYSVKTLWFPGGRMGEGTVRESGMDTDTLLCLTQRTSKDLLSSTGNSAQYSVITLWSPGGRMGEGIVRAFGMDMDTLLYLTQRTNKELLYRKKR